MIHRYPNVNNKTWIFLCILLLVIAGTFFEYKILRFTEKNDVLEAAVVRLQISNSALHRSLIENNALNSRKKNSHRDVVVIYNRVPKTASTSFVNVAYDLCKKNLFNVLHLNITGNSHLMSLSDQARFVYNITHWDEKKPGFYHGHVAYINFEKFGVNRSPIYINLIRKPLDRLVSYYYFLRFGDNYRPHLIRRKHGDKMTFDECVAARKPDCDPNNMWLQIPFLCGHSPQCWEPGNKWALEEAKRNLLERYLLVGVTEQLGEFVALLEAILPSFFRGATDHFRSSKKAHLRKTNLKIEPSEKTVSVIKKSEVWSMEQELYDFAVEQFNFAKKRMDVGVDGLPVDRGKQFTFEKISPK